MKCEYTNKRYSKLNKLNLQKDRSRTLLIINLAVNHLPPKKNPHTQTQTKP